MANKVKFGLRNVRYAKITVAENGTITYGNPVLLPGAVALSLAPAGDKVDFYADDSLYYNETVNQGYEGDLEVSNLSEAFYKDILGLEEDSNGALIENADARPSAFALGYEVQGDDKGTKFWLYNCTCARPNQDAKTKESGVTPATDKLSITVAPRLTDKKVRAKMTLSDTNATAYNSFFTSVYEEVTPSA